MSIAKNGIIVPELLSKDFFKKALENGLNVSSVEIENISITMGSTGGENYCSQIFRAAIKYSEERSSKSISMIIKYMPTHPEFIIEMQVYERELKMYFEIIPKLEKLFDNKIILAPKCFHAVAEPVQTIVFQDLIADGYELANRISGLDEKFSKILLEKISKFHATSMVLAKKNPVLVKFYNRTLLESEHSATKDDLFLGSLKFLEKYLNTWPGFESIARRIGKIKDNFYEICLKTLKSPECKIKVLNHGDLCVNNFMFQKDQKGNPIDVAFIDFQVSYWGSPGIDLNYFLNTSVRIDVLKSKRYELLRHYYASLKKTLEELNYVTIPTWDDIRREIFLTEFFGFFAFQAILPLVAMDRELSKDNSIESFNDAEAMYQQRKETFESKRLVETLKYSLDRFDEIGVFDV